MFKFFKKTEKKPVRRTTRVPVKDAFVKTINDSQKAFAEAIAPKTWELV